MCESIKSQIVCGDPLLLHNTDSKKESICLSAPVSGQVVSLSEIPEHFFVGGCYGDCAAVYTDDSVLCAPCSGRIVAVASAKHGLGILNEENGEIMVQVGVGSEKLCGEGFLPLVCMDDEVEAGDQILQFDQRVLKENDIEPFVIVMRFED